MERAEDFDVTAEELWDVVGDPDGLATWLADDVDVVLEPGAEGTVVDDGEVRHVRVEEVEPGRRVAFQWWPEDRRHEASVVEFVVLPLDRGSRLLVIERLVATNTAAPVITVGVDVWRVRLQDVRSVCHLRSRRAA